MTATSLLLLATFVVVRSPGSAFAAGTSLGVAVTSYAAATSQPGDPVTYVDTASVLPGQPETNPISVTQTVPAGVIPIGAYGTGWVCQTPVGRSVTCTAATVSRDTHGTILPAITVVAIVTGSNVASMLVQAGSTATASSSDAVSGTSSTTTAGTRPAVPAALTVTPAVGAIAGGGTATIGGTDIAAATAIEIGTTAEQQAGTPVTLLPCAGVAAPGCFTVSSGALVISSFPARAGATPVTVTVVTLGIAAATSYGYADKPAPPAAPTATAGGNSATVTWSPPASNGSAITGYVVTPYLNAVGQTALSFDVTTTTRTLTGLTAGGSYTFTVAAMNAYGTSAASAKSVVVLPYSTPSAPAITATTAGDAAATLTWSVPSNGGSAITGYLVTPYIGAAAQATQTFIGTATTQTVTALTAGTAYTFTVAAQNLAGTGSASAHSGSVTPNVSPSLTFTAPPAGEVGVAYSRTLTVVNGTSPFVWSISSGALPAGLTLNASTGLLSGTPSAGASSNFTVQVVDGSSQTATKAVTLVVAPAPTLTFSPLGAEVGVIYSQQPTITGGTGPFTWAISAGSLPPGVTLNASSGLVSGSPTAAGSFSMTVTATDSFGQVTNKTVTITVSASPAFATSMPPSGQVGVAYSTSLSVTGGTPPYSWSIIAGSLPAGLALNAGTGQLSGTPTTVGSTSFTASVIDANNQTATKAVTVVIAAGPLVIVKTANVSSAVAGATVSYTITITNTGSILWTGATLSDPLTGVVDDAVYNANATATAGTLSYAVPTLGWTGNVTAGGSVTISYSVTVSNPDVGNKVLSNTVTSTTLGANCSPATAGSDARCSATVTVPGLTIVKTADTASTTPGSTVHFTIMVTNTGQFAYPAATLTDTLAGVLDDSTYNADATATVGSVTFTSPSLIWTASLAVGASATITYSVTVANPDNGDRSMTGTVVSASAGSPCPSVSPAAQCTATVAVLVPAVVITTTASATTTTPGATVGYTLTLSNTGQTAYTAITVSAALSGALDDATYNSDAAASAGSVAFNAGAASLVWTGNLAIGAVVTITASVTVRSPDPGNKSLTTVTTSSAAGSTCPSGGSNPACLSTVQVLLPGLTISKSANVTTTTPGSVVQYTISVTNSGQTAFVAATLGDALIGVLDDAAYNNDASTTAGAVSFGGSTLSWTGNLAIAASATITYSVTVRQPDTGDKSLSGAVTSTTPGSSCPPLGTPPACTTNITVLIPGLSLTSSLDATTTPGSVVHYSVTLVDTGQTSYSGVAVTLDLTGALDDAAYNYDATITTGSLVTNPDGTVNWVLNLAPGASASGTISLTVNNPDTGDRSVGITIVSNAPGSMCPTGSANTGCRVTATVLVPGLTITKTANSSSVTPGDTVVYTILVTNSGQTAYPAASFTDNLATILTDATYAGGATATMGTLSYSAPVLSWTGALAPAASATISYSIAVRDPDPGDKRMYNTVVSAAAGSNCPQGGTDPRCTATVSVLVPGLTIGTTASAPTTAPGGTVGYTVVVTNSGATPVVGATISDSLTGVLDDASYGGGVTASAGMASFAGSVMSWTGDLAVGAATTIAFSVTVHTLDGGNNLLTDLVTSSARGTNCGVGSIDPRCTSTVAVARLILAWGAIDPTTTPGSVLRLISTFTNTGQVPYVGISVVNVAPSIKTNALSNGDQTATSGTFVVTATGALWTGSIPVGGVVTVGGTITVRNPDPAVDKVIASTRSTTAPGSNCPAGSTDTRCTFHTTVLVPELTITKTASTTATVPGGSVGYTITVHNTGQTAYTAASVTDPLTGVLDDSSYDANAAASVGTVSFVSPTLTWTGDLAPGAAATITYSITVHSPDTGDKTLINQASSAAAGSTCPPASSNSGCRSAVLVLTPALVIVKTADAANATLGTTVTYKVTVTDAGQTSYPAAAFTDSLANVLDDATYEPASANASVGTVSYAGGVLSWSGALTPGSSATINYGVTINNPSTGNLSMSNTVTSGNVGSNCPPGAGDSRCTATVAITNSNSLTFTKTADVAAVAPGAVVHYTLTALNSGFIPVPLANVTDPLAAILDDATYDGNANASGGIVVYTAPNLLWTGTVLAGSAITITYSVTVHAAVTGDQILRDTVSSTSLPGSDNCTAASTDPRCTSTVTVAALLLQQHYTETSSTPGSVVHLSATFTNTGATAYTGISVSSPSADTVDDATPTGDQAATSGTLVLSPTAITWTGNIPIGGVVTVTGTLTVQNPDLGNKVLTGTLVSAALGNNCPPGGVDPRCTALLAVLLPGLTITKTADTTSVVPGGTANYTIAIFNSGQTPYVGTTVTDTLIGVLDDATYNANAVTTAGALSYASPALIWTGALAVGATTTITYSVTVSNPDTGDKTMVNTITSSAVGSNCPLASGDPACRFTVNVLTPALTISSSASGATAVPGATVTYAITAANTGQTTYSAASINLPMAGLLDDATYGGGATATAGTVGLTGQTLTWAGDLIPGAIVTIGYSVTVNQPVLGDFQLDQTVTSTVPGSNCPPAGTDLRCTTAVPIATLSILNRADVKTATPTSMVRSTTTFTNAGRVPYVGISINVGFAPTLDDATYNGDAGATAGSLIIVTGTGTITWTGDLPVGATVVVTASATVNNPDLGDRILGSLVTTNATASNCPAGSADPACQTSVVVLIPALAIVHTADTTTVAPGAAVGYTITITNAGQTPYAAATVTNSLSGVLNDATYLFDAAATRGVVSFSNATVTWIGDLAIGDSAVVTYSVRVDNPDLGDKLMVDHVVSPELGSMCPVGGSNPSCSTLVVVLVPALDITVTADHTTAVPGDTVGYTVTIRNSGQSDYVGASVTALLEGVRDDAGFGGATSTSGRVTFADPALAWTGNVAIGVSVVVTYSVTVFDPDVGNHILATSVTSTAPGSTCGAAAQCANTVTVLIPGLAVSTTASAATATPGDQVVYTITLANTGQTPYPAAAVNTTLTGILDDATFDGRVAASIGVATYNAPNISWNHTLEVGETATITYAVTVRNPDSGDRVMSATVTALVPGSTCQGNGNPACTATVTVQIPSLSITKSVSAPTTTPGGVVGYTIVVTNNGQTAYAGTTVDDSLVGVLADAVYNGDAIVGSGTLSYATSTLTWKGDLPIGASATIRYSITVLDPDTGDKSISNSVTSSEKGSSCVPGGSTPGCSTVVQVLLPGLAIVKTAAAGSVVAGGVVRYTVTLTNTGQTAYAPAAFTDPLAGVLDDAGYAGDAVASTGTISFINSTLTWSGALGIAATATVTYSVATNFPATGDHTLTNTVFSSTPGADCTTGSDPRCSTSVAILIPALVVTKSAGTSQVVAGGSVGYTISATNTGQADYPVATLVDPLAGVLDDATYNADAAATSGTLSVVGGTLNWNGALPRGATVVISYSVTANVVDTGDGILTNRVLSSSVGSTCPTGNVDPRCATSTTVAARTITMTGLTPSFTLSGVPHATVSSNGAVTMTVITNSPNGYQVTVQAATAAFSGSAPGNTTTIPVGQILVRESGTPGFRALSAITPLVVHQQSTPSAPLGDAVSNDFQLKIPDVVPDTYSATLDYIVSAS